ncbi:hypothetical protein B9Z55_009953 [Caenorhabditis nigoni]|uniref:C2H2-type domain-containing protein n=1 Tax=Caenorhabditis nigoni TaxID=1611254 RepID=A0A2G5UU22_9PELO|nr:hypothetical protein B9Z55_009953 [Caenorhabditis nigoni]
MDSSNQRKRQLEHDNPETDASKKPMTVKDETTDSFEKGDFPATTSATISATPILDSIIATPPVPPPPKTAFRQFLNGYMQAGGDINYASALATCTAALPMPPHPLKPMISLAPLTVPSAPTLLVSSEDPATQKLSPPPAKIGDSEPGTSETSTTTTMPTLSAALGEDKEKQAEKSSDAVQAPATIPDVKPPIFPMLPPFPMIPMLPAPKPQVPESATEIQRLREAAFGRYKNVLCVICNEWICSRNRKNHIEAHLNYRPYKCSACTYARRREIFVIQHMKTQHKGQKVEMQSSVDLHVAMEVDRLADECVARTRKLIESMQEKKDGDFGENKDFDEKALELMIKEEKEKKVVRIESVTEIRPKVANYHRKIRTQVLKKIYDTDAAKQAELKIVKEEEGGEEPTPSLKLDDAFEINLDDLMKMVGAADGSQESQGSVSNKDESSQSAPTTQTGAEEEDPSAIEPTPMES